MKQEKEPVEFRYYEVPKNLPVLALLGERWEIPYGVNPMHFHNHLEIGYCHYGEGQICHGNESTAYGPGTLTVIPKNYPHCTKEDEQKKQKWEYLFIDVDQMLYTAYPERKLWVKGIIRRIESGCLILQENENTQLSLLVRLILEEMRTRQGYYKERVRFSTLSLLFGIVQLQDTGDKSLEPHKFSEKDFPFLVETLDYIGNHYKENIRMEDLTRIANMSESQYRRKFKEHMHTSPAEYINLVRIDHACELLVHSDDTIENIAKQTGFQTIGAFTRNFKKLVGELPKDWRKRERVSETNISNY